MDYTFILVGDEMSSTWKVVSATERLETDELGSRDHEYWFPLEALGGYLLVLCKFRSIVMC